MKYYVDSDGVLADFDEWVKRHDPTIIVDKNDPNYNTTKSRLYEVLVKDYKNCYLNFKPIEENIELINNLRTKNNWFVLSAIPDLYHIVEHTSNDRQAKRIQLQYIQNKIKFFENLGVPKERVIIVEDAEEKSRYANPRSTLIDDSPKNIERWVNAGGIGLLYDRKSNQLIPYGSQ